ncbi:MAG: [ribosomal protein S5]-alanine N-acetyltransferase [Actinoplanes sp.]|jgi:RimJ/RimL family protein N-acetyltransferase|nr:[ribosomal protein S5]-alanine N-acetyltransferase [Actinoplanes sp.]
MGDVDTELRTARLSLRRPSPADIDAVYRIHTDRQACAHNPADLLASRTEADDRYRNWDAHWQQHGFGYWAVYRTGADAGCPLGFCGVKFVRLYGRAVLNLFCRLDPPAWGDGVATEAAAAVAGWAATHRPGDLLVARVHADNTASRRVAERIGLRRAPHWDTDGEDGPDLLFMSVRPDDTDPPA